MVKVFLEFLMFQQIFLPPQIKRVMINNNKMAYLSCLTSGDLQN